MQETLNELFSTPLEVGWNVLIVLTVISVLDMARNLTRRVRHIFP
jgi:hypothetical protein